MNAREQLCAAIDDEERRLRETIPGDRESALCALLRLRDRIPLPDREEPQPDLIFGDRIADPGGNNALALLLASKGSDAHSGDIDAWAERFLAACADLAMAEQLLVHVETGFMRLVVEPDGSIGAWIASKQMPAGWRERIDFHWWARALARNDSIRARMIYQFPYPDEAVLGGCPVTLYPALLEQLIAEQGNAAPSVRVEQELVTHLAEALQIAPDVAALALSGFTLDRENAAYHAAVPGIAAAPVVRVAPDRIALSGNGLRSEPLLFLARELRRRDAEAYNNSGHLRESVFRNDLYALFADRRFVTSAGRINLRRTDGGLRTDIDAAIFDRKSGTLGLFELKSHEPFARSVAELVRQRDNVLYANRQVSGVLDWIKRHGADEIVHRIDPRAAKTFKAQKVFPFVLGRYLAHFSDGQQPDPRAAWGTWPQLMRLLDAQPIHPTDANPIASLFNRLAKDDPLMRKDTGLPPREIVIGDLQVMMFGSFADYQQ